VSEVVPEDRRTLVALGGGGFTMEPDNPALDDFVLSLSTASEPRILFLPTASGDPALHIAAFHERFAGHACVPAHLSLFRRHGARRPLREIVLEQDVIYIGGGSMRNLLAIWRAHGLDALLTEAWERGIVLAGLSAGAMCWFEGGITRSSGPPETIDGLGLLRGSLSVHADGEPERLPAFLEAVRAGALPGGWAVDDGVGLLFADGEYVRAVSSRPGAGAVRVDALEGELVRSRVEPELLEAVAGGVPPPGRDVEELRALARMLRRRRPGE